MDLSDTYLRPRHLSQVTMELADMYTQLRDVNLSYNVLEFRRKGSVEYEQSAATIDHLQTLMKRAKILNHVNFSGMNIAPEYLLPLCQEMSKCSLLMGIHLNDNGVTSDIKFLLEVLDVFKLKAKDIPMKRIDLIDP